MKSFEGKFLITSDIKIKEKKFTILSIIFASIDILTNVTKHILNLAYSKEGTYYTSFLVSSIIEVTYMYNLDSCY